MLKVAYSPIYVYRLPPGHRFPMQKYELLAEQLLYEGTLTDDSFFAPKAFSDSDLEYAHTPGYIERLNDLPLSRREERDIGFPVRDDLVFRGRHIAYASMKCSTYAIRHGISMNIAGGTHHAFADRGEGFCVFNDFALAARHMLRDHGVERILVVDLDVHQGNGTASIFSEEERVFTFSMHGARNYPLRKVDSDLDIGLPDHCDDKTYLSTLQKYLPVVVEKHNPQLVLFQAGVDVLKSDKLGRLDLTKEGCRIRDRYVLEYCKRNNLPVAVSMGGGYSHKISDIVDAHANTFRVAQEIFF